MKVHKQHKHHKTRNWKIQNKHIGKVYLLQTKLEISILIVQHSEECTIIEMLQTKRKQLVSSSRGDVFSPLKQWLIVTKPNTRRHFYTI